MIDIEPPFDSGKPPFDANQLEPLMPDRAGVKTSWFTIGLMIFKGLPSLPRFISNRPSVVDARVHEVRTPSPKASFPCQ